MMAYSSAPQQDPAAPQPDAGGPQATAPTGPVPEPYTQAAQQTGQELDQAAQQFGAEADKAAQQMGPAANQAANEVGAAADSAAKDLEKGLGGLGAGLPGAAAEGESGTVGQVRGATMWWLLGFLTCGLTTIFWIYKTLNELKAFTGNPEIKPIVPTLVQLFFPPWGQVFHAVKMGKWLMEARQSVGLPAEDKSKKYAIWCFILGLSLKQIQEDLNELWEAAGGGAQ